MKERRKGRSEKIEEGRGRRERRGCRERSQERKQEREGRGKQRRKRERRGKIMTQISQDTGLLRVQVYFYPLGQSLLLLELTHNAHPVLVL